MCVFGSNATVVVECAEAAFEFSTKELKHEIFQSTPFQLLAIFHDLPQPLPLFSQTHVINGRSLCLFKKRKNLLCADLTARLSWINWENLGVNPQRRSVLTSLALSSDNLQYPHN